MGEVNVVLRNPAALLFLELGLGLKKFLLAGEGGGGAGGGGMVGVAARVIEGKGGEKLSISHCRRRGRWGTRTAGHKNRTSEP